MEAILKACKSGNFDLANKEVNNFIAEGYPASQMLTQVLFSPVSLGYSFVNSCVYLLVNSLSMKPIWFFQLFEAILEDDISDEQKARISKKLGEADKVTSDMTL